jgi:hypothetical protein
MGAMEDTEDTIGFIAEKGKGSGLLEVVDNVGSVAYEVSDLYRNYLPRLITHCCANCLLHVKPMISSRL